MRVEINRRLVKRNRQIAQYLFFFSLGVLIVGFIVTNSQTIGANADNPLISLVLPTLVLPVGLITTLVSVNMTNTWIRQPRPEKEIQEGLKGIIHKGVLYHYYHQPAAHVLISSQGVFAIITRFQNGHFTVDGDKWSGQRGIFSSITRLFRQDAIKNPTQDAINAANHLETLLQPIAPDVPVQPLVVFYDPNVRLDITNPAVPVLFADTKRKPNLKDYLRDVAKEKRPTLSPEQINAFEEATIRR